MAIMRHHNSKTWPKTVVTKTIWARISTDVKQETIINSFPGCSAQIPNDIYQKSLEWQKVWECPFQLRKLPHIVLHLSFLWSIKIHLTPIPSLRALLQPGSSLQSVLSSVQHRSCYVSLVGFLIILMAKLWAILEAQYCLHCLYSQGMNYVKNISRGSTSVCKMLKESERN